MPKYRYWKIESEETTKTPWHLIDWEQTDLKQIKAQGAMFMTTLVSDEPPMSSDKERADYLSNAVMRHGPLYLDLDAKDQDTVALAEVQALIFHVLPKFGIPDSVIHVWHSGGKGYHIMVPDCAFGDESGSRILPWVHEAMFGEIKGELNKLIQKECHLDDSLYVMGKGKMLRIQNVKRPSGRYKVPMKVSELAPGTGLSIDEINTLTLSPRYLPYHPPVGYKPDAKALGLWNRGVAKANAKLAKRLANPPKVLSDEQVENLLSDLPPCIQHTLSMTDYGGLPNLNFNKLCAYILVPYFINAGFSLSDSEDAVADFIAGFDGSESYSTTDQRLDHFRGAWKDASKYTWQCDVTSGLLKFKCDDCSVKRGDPNRTTDPTVAFRDAWVPELPEELDDLKIPHTPTEEPPEPIRIRAGLLASCVNLAEKALMYSGVPYHDTMYQRGGQLVRVCRLPEGGTERGVSRPAGVVVIQRVTADFLLQALASNAQFLKVDGRTKDKKWVPADPPKQLAELILARSGKWPFPPLRGVLACPTVRPDGSLLLKPGYDLASGYFMAHKLNVQVPDSPGKTEAVGALEKLKALLEGFAFVEPVDQAVAVSLILTAVIRAALDTAPLITTTATTRGSGKTTLGDTAAVLATGRCCPAVAATMDRQELEKRLVASLLSGDAIVNLDNINGELGSDLLCQATTGPALKIRPLGSSTPVEIPNTALWIANGNNMTVTGDLARRTLKCRLDPGVERPELRQFAFNPIHEAGKRREELLGACLTLVWAYVVAGKPSVGKPAMGSFEAWSELVRNPILWAGGVDPCDSYEMVVDEDPEAENLRALLESWQACFGEERKTIKEAMEIGKEGFAPEGLEEAVGELRAVVDAVAGGARDEAKAVGRFIGRCAGRIAGGKKFVKTPAYKGTTTWRVVSAVAEAKD